MANSSPQMKNLFGGTAGGGFFDLPPAPCGDTGGAGIVVGTLVAARLLATVMGLAARQIATRT